MIIYIIYIIITYLPKLFEMRKIIIQGKLRKLTK